MNTLSSGLKAILMVWLLGQSATLAARPDTDAVKHPAASYFDAAGDHAALYQGRIEPTFPLLLWNTHPYWDTNDFTNGDICFNGVVYHDVGIRYDVYNNAVAVHAKTRNLSILPDQRLIDWFVVGDDRFVQVEGRFVRVLFEGEHLLLVHRRTKDRTGDEIDDKNRTRHVLFSRDEYLLLAPEALLAKGLHSPIAVKSVKAMTKAFPTYQNDLRRYSKQQKLKSDNRHLATALTALAEYLEKQFPTGTPARVITQPQGASQTIIAPDSIFTASETLQLTAYLAYQPGGTPEYPSYEEYSAPELTSELLPIREDHILDEVTIRGFQQKVASAQVGMERFRASQLRNIPVALGEADVMKMVQTLPGVKTMGEAASGFNVRGGAADQNLILLNGNTVYNPMHLFGIFSAFNSDVIGETELYKSGIPTQYGGRISSVMDIHSRVADREHWHGSASIGLLTSKATLEAPLAPGRASLLIGGRTTYSDWMLGMLPEKSGYRNGSAGFWDASATLSSRLGRNHNLNVYAYGSQDRFSFTEYDRYGYTNLNAAIEWKGRYRGGASSTVTAGVDHYDYYNEQTEVPQSAARLSFAIEQYFLRANIAWNISEAHHLTAGLHTQLNAVAPGRYEPVGDKSAIATQELRQDRALESALFAEDRWAITSHLSLNMGLRYSLFNAMREGKEHTYQAPEVRLALNYMIDEDQSVKAGFNTMHQFIHKVSNTSIMSPTDTWALSNDRIRPQTGWQAAAGYYRQSHDAQYELSLEAYYKQMSDYLTYRSAGQLLMNPDLENDVIATRGRAYGIELQLRKTTGKLNGWISYAYARTELQQADGTTSTSAINGGDWFPADYDRPHELKVVANYKFTERYSLSLNADYGTGRPTTVPAGQYYNSQQDRYLPYYTLRNSYRLPDYFRLDGSFNIEPSHHLTALTHSWFSIGCYNLLGRRNAYSVYYISENGVIRGYQLSIFGAQIPFVSYNIKF